MGRIVEAEGQRFELPDDATDEDVVSFLNQQFPSAPPATAAPAEVPAFDFAKAGYANEAVASPGTEVASGGTMSGPPTAPPDPGQFARHAQYLASRLDGLDPRSIRLRFYNPDGTPNMGEVAPYLANVERRVKALSDKAGWEADSLRAIRAIFPGGSDVSDAMMGEREAAWYDEVANYRRGVEKGEGVWGALKSLALDSLPGLPGQFGAVMVGGGAGMGAKGALAAATGRGGMTLASGITGAAANREDPMLGFAAGAGGAMLGMAASRLLAPAGSGAARIIGAEAGGNVGTGMAVRAASGGDALDPSAILFDAATGLGGAVPRLRGMARQRADVRAEAADRASVIDQGSAALRGFRPQEAQRPSPIEYDLANVKSRFPKLSPDEQMGLAREIANQRAFLNNQDPAQKAAAEAALRRLDPEIAAEEMLAAQMREQKMVDLEPPEALEAYSAIKATQAEIDAADDIGTRIDRLATMPKDQLVGMGGGRAARLRQRGTAGMIPEESMIQFFARWENETRTGLSGGRRVLMERFGLDGPDAEAIINKAITRGLVTSDAAQFSRESTRQGYGRDPMPRVAGQRSYVPEGSEPIGPSPRPPQSPQEPTGRSEPPSEPPVAPGAIQGPEPVLGDPGKPGEAAPPKPLRGMGGQAGAAYLPVDKAAAEVKKNLVVPGADFAWRVIQRFLPLKARVGMAAGADGPALEQMAERALDNTMEHQARLGPRAEAAMRAANGSNGRVFQQPRGDFEPSLLMDSLEGRANAAPDVTAPIRTYLDEAILLEHQAGFIRQDGSPVPAKSPAAPRIHDAEALDIVRTGRWKALGWGEKLAKMPANEAAGFTPEDGNAHFEEMQKALNSDGPDANEIAMASEFSREWPAYPGWAEVNGEIVPVLESNPFRYAQRLHHGKQARYAFGKTFGQGPDSPVDAILANMEASSRQKVRDMLRAMHLAPVEQPLVEPGSRMMPLVRGFNSALGLTKSMALTANAVVNGIPELLFGGTARQGRYLNTVKALWNTIARYRATADRAESFGSKTREPVDRTIDPARPVTSRIDRLSRLLRHGGTSWMEEIQETFAAEKARLEAGSIQKNIKAGGAVETDLALIRGFTDASAQDLADLASGKIGAQRFTELATQFLRRLPSETQGSNLNPAQISRNEHSRWQKALFAFTRFNSMYIRAAVKNTWKGGQSIADGMAEGNFRKVAVGTSDILKVLGGTALMNGSATLVASLMFGGPEKLKSKWNELTFDPIAFFLRSLGSGLLAGPAGAIVRSLGDDRSVVDLMWPTHIAKQFGGMLGFDVGERAYLGKNPLQRIGAFLSRTTPLVRSLDQGLLSLAWSDENVRQLRAAKGRYYQFLGDLGKAPSRDNDGYSEWDGAMERVARRVVDGDIDPEALSKDIEAAALLGTKGIKSVRASLLGKRLLKDLNKAEMAAFLKYATPEEVEALRVHDLMLERVAQHLPGGGGGTGRGGR